MWTLKTQYLHNFPRGSETTLSTHFLNNTFRFDDIAKKKKKQDGEGIRTWEEKKVRNTNEWKIILSDDVIVAHEFILLLPGTDLSPRDTIEVQKQFATCPSGLGKEFVEKMSLNYSPVG